MNSELGAWKNAETGGQFSPFRLAVNNPEAIKAAFQNLSSLQKATVQLIPPNESQTAPAIMFSPENAAFTLPIAWRGGVPASLAGGASLSQVISTINYILDRQREIQG